MTLIELELPAPLKRREPVAPTPGLPRPHSKSGKFMTKLWEVLLSPATPGDVQVFFSKPDVPDCCVLCAAKGPTLAMLMRMFLDSGRLDVLSQILRLKGRKHVVALVRAVKWDHPYLWDFMDWVTEIGDAARDALENAQIPRTGPPDDLLLYEAAMTCYTRPFVRGLVLAYRVNPSFIEEVDGDEFLTDLHLPLTARVADYLRVHNRRRLFFREILANGYTSPMPPDRLLERALFLINYFPEEWTSGAFAITRGWVNPPQTRVLLTTILARGMAVPMTGLLPSTAEGREALLGACLDVHRDGPLLYQPWIHKARVQCALTITAGGPASAHHWQFRRWAFQIGLLWLLWRKRTPQPGANTAYHLFQSLAPEIICYMGERSARALLTEVGVRMPWYYYRRRGRPAPALLASGSSAGRGGTT